MSEKTLYQELGVGKAAGDGEILRALRTKAESGEWNLEKIREVKSVLLDEEKRAEYDKTIEPKPLSDEENEKIQQVIAQYQMQMAMENNAAQNAIHPGASSSLPPHQDSSFNVPDTTIPVAATINARPIRNEAMVSNFPCP